MVIFDAHCDTIQKITDYDENLFCNKFHFDIERALKAADGYIQVFAAFINKKNDLLPPFQRCMAMIEKYLSETEILSDYVKRCESFNDICDSVNSGKVAAILGVEGGEAIEGSIENLFDLYKKGVRMMTLTWNYSNEICGGICQDNAEGLTDFGKRVVSEMNTLGMIVDVSHISVKGFWDVLEHSETPIVASHSNAFALCPHRRNLSDEQIKAIIQKDGCIGINLYPPFLTEGHATVVDVIRHIEYILALGGENNIGLGCDFDGVDKLPSGISGICDLHLLFDEMHKLGYSDVMIKKITSENFLRITKKILY